MTFHDVLTIALFLGVIALVLRAGAVAEWLSRFRYGRRSRRHERYLRDVSMTRVGVGKVQLPQRTYEMHERPASELADRRDVPPNATGSRQSPSKIHDSHEETQL